MNDVIFKTLYLVSDFVFYSFGMSSSVRCDLILAVCSALCCVAVIRLFWTLFD